MPELKNRPDAIEQCSKCAFVYRAGTEHQCPLEALSPVERAAIKMHEALKEVQSHPDFLGMDIALQNSINSAVTTGDRWL